MAKIIEPQTQRLKLRQWQPADRPHFARLNADPEVMKYFTHTLNPEQSMLMAQKMESKIAAYGWGFWAVEKRDSQQFIGFVGLNKPDYELPVSPCVEIGWRLAREYWGHGYATEAAQASLAVAFEKLQLPEIFAFTSLANQKSQAVMQRLGMRQLHNFEHPMVPEHHPLREHVLFRIDQHSWSKRQSQNGNNGSHTHLPEFTR
ncbi:MAG: GNAT family N-acetyltransferase [Gammaproteobacteria bacterium]|jgi:RimJ/RimL family protein N-acetyltransferase|nr:GNAT family N-acetyltransferase [Gammaproteobacteria bacterium]